MSLILLFIAFVTTGIGNITSKAIHEWGLDGYREIYLIAFYGVGAIISIVLWKIRPVQTKAYDRNLGLYMGVSGALGLVYFMLAIAGMQGIIVFPVRSMANVILTAAVSFYAWKERLSFLQWLGIAASLGAIFLLHQ